MGHRCCVAAVFFRCHKEKLKEQTIRSSSFINLSVHPFVHSFIPFVPWFMHSSRLHSFQIISAIGSQAHRNLSEKNQTAKIPLAKLVCFTKSGEHAKKYTPEN